jgi:hypothetical protein
MLKEVDASGQISLGKKYAKRLFEVVVHPDDHFELILVKVVPHLASVRAPAAKSAAGWLPPGGYTSCNQWALDNRVALVAYADRIAEQGTAAEQLHEFLDNTP